MGFFAGLEAEKYDRKYSDRVLFGRIGHYFKPHLKKLSIAAALVLVISGSNAIQPIIVSRTVNDLNASLTVQQIMLLFGMILLAGVVTWSANWGLRRTMTRIIAAVVFQLGSDAFNSAAEHDLSFYDQFTSGRIASRITSDTQDFGELVSITSDVISQLAEAVILAIVLVNIDLNLSLIMFAVIPFVILLTMAFRGMARNVTRTGMRAMATVNQTIKETVSGISIAKNFRQEAHIYDIFDSANATSYQVNVKRGMVLSAVFPTLNTLGGLMTAYLVYQGALSAAAGAVTIGAWYLFISSLDRFMGPIMNLSSYWTQIQNGLSAAERVFALIDAEPAVRQIAANPAPQLNGRIDFNHLSFHYKENEPILQDFDLHISPGENVAFVGHTGAGKSSLAKLIARFYEYQAGSLLVDGIDIRSFDLPSFRSQLGIVTQVPFLFAGSVIENIRYSCPQTSEAEIRAIAHTIGDGEWVETLPEGLQTEVGERGARLSMGQRQLVSMMRVLVQKPAIFILDEATASVDPFTEWQIQQALNLILARSTSILIAHRLSTVRAVDRIIVIDHGRIIEEGNHDQLLAQGGHYSTLYNTYFRHQSLAYVEEAGKFKQR
jgi:ATP-binding cassette subfamily B protein